MHFITHFYYQLRLNTRFYLGLEIASNLRGNLENSPLSTTVTHHQYGLSALIPLESFGGETVTGGVTKCRLLSQASNLGTKVLTLERCKIRFLRYFRFHFSERLLSEIITKHVFQELDEEREKIVHELLQRGIQVYYEYHTIATPEGVSGLIDYILTTHKFAFKSVGLGCLEITFRCPSLESLESLWSDYQSGHLNHIAERYLVTDDIKKKLNLESIRLETTIEEENYRICKEILMEKSCKPESSLLESVFNLNLNNWKLKYILLTVGNN